MTLETTLRVVGTRPIRPDGVEKVTGRANFGADRAVPGMLYGKIKRSPHAHARILGINADKALALAGVKAVVTAADFPEIRSEEAFVGEGPMNFRDLSRNVMARGKVLYEGHAVAAVAALSAAQRGAAWRSIGVVALVLGLVAGGLRVWNQYNLGGGWVITTRTAAPPNPATGGTYAAVSEMWLGIFIVEMLIGCLWLLSIVLPTARAQDRPASVNHLRAFSEFWAYLLVTSTLVFLLIRLV